MEATNSADFNGIVDSMTQLEIDIERQRYQCAFNPNRDPVHLAVVAAVTTAKGCEPTDLTPLHSAIDPDVLDSVFSDNGNTLRRNGRLTFNYEGFVVTLFSHGTLEIEPAENAD